MTEDWLAVWPIFRETVAAGDTYEYDPATSEDGGRQLWLRPAPAETWIAVEDGAVLGTYLLMPNGHGLRDHVANAGFIVGSTARGRGLGRALAEHCLDRARALGFTAMQFNAVVATNTGALKLWRSLGFIIIGTVPDGFRHAAKGLVDLHIMHRYL